MTDRELLELAAKAAWIEVWFSKDWHDTDQCYTGELKHPEPWNPLNNDGDALRLAVMLGVEEIFTVSIVGGGGYVSAGDANLRLNGAEERLLEDPYAAARRAIVRAAAEIGRSME